MTWQVLNAARECLVAKHIHTWTDTYQHADHTHHTHASALSPRCDHTVPIEIATCTQLYRIMTLQH